MIASIIAGISAGALHVLSGVDHLVAMAPNTFHHPRVALFKGLAWGLGHSTGIIILSIIAVLINDLASIHWMSTLAEFTVGIVLFSGGMMAIKSSLNLKIHSHQHNHFNSKAHRHVHLHFLRKQKHSNHSHSTTCIGMLHGLAGGGHLIAVLPALAFPPAGAIAYMLAYLVGSILTMSSVVMAISLARLKSGWHVSPLTMGLTGGLSVAIGLFWLKETAVQLV